MGCNNQLTGDWVRSNLVLFGTDGCHLCHEALELIESAIGHLPPEIDIIDLPEVAYQFLEVRIPVLYVNMPNAKASYKSTIDSALNELKQDQCLFWPFQPNDVCALVNKFN